jgi:hypothetical protein
LEEPTQDGKKQSQDVWERIVRDVVREQIMGAVHLSETYGYSLEYEISKVVEDMHKSGTGLRILTKMSWPPDVAKVINDLLNEQKRELDEEQRQTEILQTWRQYNLIHEEEKDEEGVIIQVGLDLSDPQQDTETTTGDVRCYFVRPTAETEEMVGVDLE